MAGLWIVSGEIQRRQGRLVPTVAKYYRSSNAALAPLNLWVSKNSFAPDIASTEGSGQLPDMNAFFPRHSVLQDNWTDIRDEALNLYHNGYATKINKDLFFSNIADQHWKKFYLKWYPTDAEGSCLKDARILCPQTAALLESLPEIHMAMFSILDPGAQIIPHHGVWKNVVRYHLCLAAPRNVDDYDTPALNISDSIVSSHSRPLPMSAPGCSIYIDGHIRYTWKDGEDVLFDDTYVHSVQNNTSEPRIILLCDVERKMASSFAQKINHWFSTTLGPMTTKKNDKVEKSSAQR